MSDAVKDGIGDNGIGKESWPIGHCPIGGEDDALGAESAIDNHIEALCRCLVNAFEAEVVDDQQINGEESLEELRELVVEIGSGEFREQVAEAMEGNSEHHATSLVGKGFRQMSLAGTCGTDEKDALAALDEAAGGKPADEFSAD